VLGRRRRTALRSAAAAAVIFAAGWLSGTWSDAPTVRRPAVSGGAATVGAPPPAVEPPFVPGPEAIERALAQTEPEERRAALRRVGDAYLGGGVVDPSAALLCYQELLDDPAAGEPLEISSGDTWLLKALKVARR
jgi:hypothetical protein